LAQRKTPLRKTRKTSDDALDSLGRGRRQDAKKIFDGRDIKARTAGRAHLPHRCVERWSIVVPWIGYSLSAILKQFEPAPKAKYIAFQSYYDAGQMPHSKYTGIDYPYVEGLRMDEAMHPLTLLCVGMYG